MADSKKLIPNNGILAPLAMSYPITFKGVPAGFAPPQQGADGIVTDGRWLFDEAGNPTNPVLSYTVKGVPFVVPTERAFDKNAFMSYVLNGFLRNGFISEPKVPAPFHLVTAAMWDEVLKTARENPSLLAGTVITTPQAKNGKPARGWNGIVAAIPIKKNDKDTPIHAHLLSKGMGATPEVVDAWKAARAEAGKKDNSWASSYKMLFLVTKLVILFDWGGSFGSSININGTLARDDCPAIFDDYAARLIMLFSLENLSLLTSLSPEAIKMPYSGSITYEGPAGPTVANFPLGVGHGITPDMVISYTLKHRVGGDVLSFFENGATEATMKNVPMFHAQWAEGMKDNVDMYTLLQFAMMNAREADGPLAPGQQPREFYTATDALSLTGQGFFDFYKFSFTLKSQENVPANPQGVNCSAKTMRLSDFIIKEAPIMVEKPRASENSSAPITKESKEDAINDIENMFKC